jgi:hypothetical protein
LTKYFEDVKDSLWWEYIPLSQNLSINIIQPILVARAVHQNSAPPTHYAWNAAGTIETLHSIQAKLLEFGFVPVSLSGYEKNPQEVASAWYFHPVGAALHLGGLGDSAPGVTHLLDELEVSVDPLPTSTKLESPSLTIEINCVIPRNSQLEKDILTLAGCLDIEPPRGSIYMMMMTQAGPRFILAGNASTVEFEPNNYSSEAVAAYQRISSELVSPRPRGRLTIVNGCAGTGKTYFIRGLLRSVRAAFAVVPQHALAGLLDPSGLPALLNFTQEQGLPVVLILEDADDALAPREQGDTSAISALLNLGDGIVGATLDVRILATTNREHQEFDDAVLRPGRLSTALTIGKLDPAQANAVFERLTKTARHEPYTKPTTLATIYQEAFDSEWNQATQKSKRMGFGND